MPDDLKELKLLLADVIEGMAATDRLVNELASAVVAMREALYNYDSSGRIEVQYKKLYEAPSNVAIRQRMSADVSLLLEAARLLRK